MGAKATEYEKIMELASNAQRDEVVVYKQEQAPVEYSETAKRKNPFYIKKKGYFYRSAKYGEAYLSVEEEMYPEWIKVLTDNGWEWDDERKCYKICDSQEAVAFGRHFLQGKEYDPDD